MCKLQPVHPEVQKRSAALEKLEESGTFASINNCSDYLQSHVRARILNAILAGENLSTEAVLLEATEQGCAELATEAATQLDTREAVGAIETGQGLTAEVGPVTWSKEKGYGTGTITVW